MKFNVFDSSIIKWRFSNRDICDERCSFSRKEKIMIKNV